MEIKERIRPWVQDLAMRIMDDLRPNTVGLARGDVLEVGFGTGRNLPHYSTEVRSVWGLDPMITRGVGPVERRIEQSPFPVQRTTLSADEQLPFDEARFDCVVTTWTLCSIPDPDTALREMRRVLKPGGLYLFLEHGRARKARTARWQDRLNPIWTRLSEGCNLNRPIDEIVQRAGFELRSVDELEGKGPPIVSHLYRGVATRG
ncbi:MAG: class I SAM-dependent methyltransferase [Myxococcales bacterium]